MNAAYLMLKTAQSLYGMNPTRLEDTQRERVRRLVERQHLLETRVLESAEARGVVVPPASLEAALREIGGRYASPEEFSDDLADNGLDHDSFGAALERELKVEAVLEKVGSRAARVSDIDVELYYRLHPEQFTRPETRLARHILITINDELPDNTRARASHRIAEIGERLRRQPGRFEEQALKHSECPTALSGGLLGEVPGGQLYPELDAALFRLEPRQLSGIVESELGLHLLRCDRITPAGPLPFEQVREAIRELLTAQRKRICQRAWLKQNRIESGQ